MTIRKAFDWSLLALTLTPLVYADVFFFPMVAPKAFFARTLLIIALASFLYLLGKKEAFFFSRLKNPLSWLPAGLLAWAYGASALGIDFLHSFWSVYDRMDGLLAATAATVFFYLALLSYDMAKVKRFLSFTAHVSGIVALYAVLQWIQEVTGMNIPLIADASGRIGATLGNAAFLAGYLTLATFASLASANLATDLKKKRRFLVLAGLAIVGVILAATRGSILALLAALGAYLVYRAWKGKGARRFRIALALLLVATGLFMTFRAELARVPFEPVARLASISVEDVTTASRLAVWQGVFAESLKSPVTGVGAEHIAVLFNRIYDPSLLVEEWFDRSHNLYLDYLAQYGFPGLALFLALIGALLARSFVLLRKGSPLGVPFVLATIAYLVQSLVVFDTVATTLLILFFFAGTFVSDKDSATPLRRSVPAPLATGLAVLALVALVPVVLNPLRANLALGQGYLYHVADIERAVASFKEGLQMTAFADLEYGYQAYAMYTDRQQTMLEGQERFAAYTYAHDLLAKNFVKYPYDARTAIYFAHVLDTHPPEAGDVSEEIATVIARGKELSPKRGQSYYIEANQLLRSLPPTFAIGTFNETRAKALAIIDGYAATVPGYAEPLLIAAELAEKNGDLVTASAFVERAVPAYREQVGDAKRFSAWYIRRGDFAKALPYLEDLVHERPEDLAIAYDLAKVRYLVGDSDGAVALFREIYAKDPGLAESDPAFLADMLPRVQFE